MENEKKPLPPDFVDYLRFFLYGTKRGEREYGLDGLVYRADEFAWWANRQALKTSGELQQKWLKRRRICAQLEQVKYDKTHGKINRALMLCQAARILHSEG